MNPPRTLRFDATIVFRRRNELGLSLRDVADRIGWSVRAVSDLENEIIGHDRLTPGTLHRLADVLALSVQELLHTDPATPAQSAPDDIRMEAALLIARNKVPRRRLAETFGWTLQHTSNVGDQLEARLLSTGCRLLRTPDYRLVPSTSALTRAQVHKAARAGNAARGVTKDMARILRDLLVNGDSPGSLQYAGNHQRVQVARLINCGFVHQASRTKRIDGDVRFSLGLAGETQDIALAALPPSGRPPTRTGRPGAHYVTHLPGFPDE